MPHIEVAVAVIEDACGRVLVQRRPEDAMLGGLWEFPGGKREEGEALIDACRRELVEELGLAVEVGPLVARVDHAYSHFTVTLHAFRCRADGVPHHHAGQPLRWASPAELAALAMPRASRRIVEALDDRLRRPTLF